MLQKVQFTKEKETLLIPLFAKALDNRRKDPILRDQGAEEIVARIDYDFQRLGSFGGSGLMVIRAKQLDEWINDFLSHYHNSMVVNLGCGLDTRVLRIDPPTNVLWYDLDFPEVIELREKFFPRRDNYFMIASSVTDPRWLDQISKDRPAMIVAEGLLEYLTEIEVTTLFNRVTSHFPQGQVAFDVLNSFAIRQGNSKMRRTTGATLHWAIDDAREIQELDPKLIRMSEQPLVGLPYVQKLTWNYRVLYSFTNLIPFLRNMLFRLLLYRF
jgi:O-methyltransferase involved in polyketide biosynthesis